MATETEQNNGNGGQADPKAPVHYPLRRPEEDPGWAVKVVKIWLGVALASGAFILLLIILGLFYD